MRLLHRVCRPNGWFANFMMRRMGKRLRLDPEQMSKLKVVQSKMQTVHAEMHGEKQTGYSDVESLLKAEKLDRKAALQLLLSSREAVESRLSEMVDGFADLFDSLNAVQRERMVKMWHNRCHCSCGISA